MGLKLTNYQRAYKVEFLRRNPIFLRVWGRFWRVWANSLLTPLFGALLRPLQFDADEVRLNLALHGTLAEAARERRRRDVGHFGQA